jgi:hypothetical protein
VVARGAVLVAARGSFDRDRTVGGHVVNALTRDVMDRMVVMEVEEFGEDPLRATLTVAAFFADGAAVRGQTLDDYAAWVNDHLNTNEGMDEFVAHCEAVLNHATVREYQRPKN